jgi:hypothetical protein
MRGKFDRPLPAAPTAPKKKMSLLDQLYMNGAPKAPAATNTLLPKAVKKKVM